MMKTTKRKLTLDRPANYQIIVPGMLDKHWSDWNEKMTVAIENDDDGQTITMLTGTVDQAALHGILRRLYSLGIPLISITCLDANR